MSIALKDSQTKLNLLKGFAGESQARNRYTFAAGIAKQQNLYVIQWLFEFTAGQEKEHGEIYYNHLGEFAGQNIEITATYPIDIDKDLISLLRSAEHNEFEEYDPVYSSFAAIAREEGFPQIANSFQFISAIEKTHGERFGHFADLMTQNKLFTEDSPTEWMCLNCGHIHSGTKAPDICPVCSHNQGYFIRNSMAPFQG